MSENASETLSPNLLKAKKLKIIKVVLLLFVIFIGLALFAPVKNLFTKKTEEDSPIQQTQPALSQPQSSPTQIVVIPREVRTAPAKVDAAGPVVPIDSFVVNLQPENGQTYLQINMSLNMTDTAGEDLAKARMAEIRSRILMLISDKKPSELVTSANKQRLADDLVAKLNEPLSGGVTLNVVSIFFTSFVLEQ